MGAWSCRPIPKIAVDYYLNTFTLLFKPMKLRVLIRTSIRKKRKEKNRFGESNKQGLSCGKVKEKGEPRSKKLFRERCSPARITQGVHHFQPTSAILGAA